MESAIFLKTSLVLMVLFSVGCFAQDKPPKTYPESGKVIAIRTTEKAHNVPVHTDSQGKTWGGGTAHHPFHIYRIETESRFYEFEDPGKNARFTIGQQIEFRIEKEHLFIQNGEKEHKYSVTDVEEKPGNAPDSIPQKP